MASRIDSLKLPEPVPPCVAGPDGRCAKRHGQIMEALAKLSQDLGRREAQRVKFSRCLAALEEDTGLSNSTLMLLSPDGQELRVEAVGASDRGADLPGRYRPGEGITGEVLKTGEGIAVANLAEDARFQDRVHARRRGGKHAVGFICVPVKVEDTTVGTLSADTVAHDVLKLRETRMLLEILAGMVAYDVTAQRMVLLEEEIAERQRGTEEYGGGKVMGRFVGDSSSMREVFRRIKQVASSDTTVLIRGETGTGKELVAAAIHEQSPRKDGPFVKVNCAALSESLLESELFGHEKGAFTGALYQRKGRLEEAEGGTLFLDEIGDFSPAIQVKMLRVLQEKEYERVGSNQTLKADVRVVCATNVDLEAAVKAMTFRADLFYRINIFPIHVAPLRKRKSDILLLANYFVNRHASRIGKDVHRLSTPAINMLTAYHWPGNVRELENCIEYAILTTSTPSIKGQDLPPTLQFPDHSDTEEAISLKDRVEVVERDCIVDALKRYHGNVTAASRELGITARMVRYKIQNLNLPDPASFKKK